MSVKYPGLAKVQVEETVSGLAHVGREVVVAVGMHDLQILRDAVKAIDGKGGIHHLVHTLPAEVGVVERGIDEDGARGQRADQFVEVEGDLGQAPAIIRQPGHVTGLAPAAAGLPIGGVSAVVVEEGVEAATGDYDLDARVKDGRVNGVVPAQGVADGAELPLADEGQ